MSSFLKSHGVSSSSNRRQQQLFDSLAFSSELTSNPDTFRLSTLNDGNAHVRAAAPAFGSSGLGTAPLVGYDGELSCVAFDPLQSLLAVGTKSGQVTVYGEPRRIPKCSWQLRPSQAVKHLVLKSGTSCVVVIGGAALCVCPGVCEMPLTYVHAAIHADAKDTLHVFDLADLDDHGQPNRLIAHSLRSSVKCVVGARRAVSTVATIAEHDFGRHASLQLRRIRPAALAHLPRLSGWHRRDVRRRQGQHISLPGSQPLARSRRAAEKVWCAQRAKQEAHTGVRALTL